MKYTNDQNEALKIVGLFNVWKSNPEAFFNIFVLIVLFGSWGILISLRYQKENESKKEEI